MCEPITLSLLAAGMSAAGSGASMVSQNNQLQQQDQTAAAGIMRQGAINRQAQNQVSNLTQKIATSNPNAIAANLKAQYAAALQNNGTNTEPSEPGGSKRYGQATATANANIGAYGGQQADIASRVNAPTLQRLGESEQIGATAGNLGGLQNQSNNQSALTKTEIESIGANPWLSAMGGVLKGAGAGIGAYGAASVASGGGANAGVNTAPTNFSSGSVPMQDPSITGSGIYNLSQQKYGT